MVVNTYNLGTQEGEVPGCEFKASLSYIAKPCLKKPRV
jgi:hypothetical protein